MTKQQVRRNPQSSQSPKKERKFYEAHLHWVLHTRPFLVILAGLALIFFAGALPLDEKFIKFTFYTALLILLIGSGMLLISYIQHRSSRFIVTDRRLIIQDGVFNRSSLSINLSHIEIVEVNQTLLGRMLNYGEVNITATGGSGTEKPIEYLGNPNAFRERLQTIAKKKA